MRSLPFSAIRIGVTGHRTLTDPERITRSVNRVLAELDGYCGVLEHGYRAISPLAEGADRLVARCVLEWKRLDSIHPILPPQLEVVLPMPIAQYVETFDSKYRQKSIADFEELLAQAAVPPQVVAEGSHGKSFEEVGRYVVRNCDVLIAVSDGKGTRGRGGTAEIVEFAMKHERSMFLVDAETGETQSFHLETFVQQLNHFNEYNREPVEEASETEVASQMEKQQKTAAEVKLDAACLQPLSGTILPHFVKASRLAAKYQTRYFWTVTAAYILSAIAVASAAGLTLFFDQHPLLFLIEAGEIATIGILVWPGFRQTRLRKWIDYRYFAERLRASCFLYVAGLTGTSAELPPDLRLSWLPENWVVRALGETWRTLPQPHVIRAAAGEDYEKIAADFIRRAWIEPQRRYYKDHGRSNREMHERLEKTLAVLLLLTLLVALAHAFFHHQIAEVAGEHSLSFAAVTLPAIASAIAGISIFRHFNRNAERYESMSGYLTQVADQLLDESFDAAGAHLTLQDIIREVDRWTSHEHQGWRVVFGVHLPGPG